MNANRRTVRRQHTVSKFYLKGFAAEEKTLTRLVLETGKSHPISVNDATVVKDFYSVEDEGHLDDFFERRFAEIEDPAAIALRHAIDLAWPLAPREREAMATWIALQHLRGHALRDATTEIQSLMYQLLVGSAGKRALRQHIERAENTPCSPARVDAEWDDLTQPGGTRIRPDARDHLRLIVDLLETTRERLSNHRWALQVFDRRTLLTADHPVSLVAAEDHPSWQGVGIANAGGFVLPLSRRRSLVIVPSAHPQRDVLGPGTTHLAREINALTLQTARRHAYHHPADATLAALPTRWTPRTRELHPDFGDDFINPDRELTETSPVDQGRVDLGAGVTLADLPWPIPGRQFRWAEPRPAPADTDTDEHAPEPV
ncbi:DUF4238 domain-containing protein [Cellulomonas sp. Y8]|uniref:DUF4238 domain-containing protein n=1 Tax=Cellulomonas sp. Y8 TaxID=2591145 RepID=UPI0011C7F035|nr:DUF4238 domain-containing protein [Cellulomonas sp. Y8]